MHIAFAAMFAFILFRRPLLLVVVACLWLVLALKVGWRRGGGPPWWMPLLIVLLALLSFSVRWLPSPEWHPQGVIQGVAVAARLLGMLSAGVWMMAGLSPVAIVRAVECLLIPLRRFHIIRHFSLSLSIAFSSSQWLRRESERWKLAIAARCICAGRGLRARIKYIQAFFSMLIVSSLRRSDSLAVALYCRGWRDDAVTMTGGKTSVAERWRLAVVWCIALGAGLADRWL